MNYPGLKPAVSQVKGLNYLRFAPGGHSSPSLKARGFLAGFINLTRFFRRNEIPRVIKNLGGCREWAIEDIANWRRIIADGKQFLLDHARKQNDTQFLEAVRKFEPRGRR
jgi:hypothetical protein